MQNFEISTNTIPHQNNDSSTNADEWTIVNGQDLETKSNNTVSIATEEALEKLQDRFRRTMQVYLFLFFSFLNSFQLFIFFTNFTKKK